jgi:predicted NAD/FAD-binding protein
VVRSAGRKERKKMRKERILVIGGGVAGISSAYLLSKKYDVTVIEKNDYLGGHTNTITVEDDSLGTIGVDTGFIVCNRKNYPNFFRLLKEWDVETQTTDMSFGYFDEESGLGYTGPSPKEFIRQWHNIFRSDFRSMAFDQFRFNRRAVQDLSTGELLNLSIEEYLQRVGVNEEFIHHYLLPVSAAIWSSPDQGMLNFPAEQFLHFFQNHGMLEFRKRPTWHTVVGGSQEYVKKFRAQFSGEMILGEGVAEVIREKDGIIAILQNGERLQADYAVLATHADLSFQMLQTPTEHEVAALQPWSYNNNCTILHTDTSLMPPKRDLWACWNYHRRKREHEKQSIAITYSMNLLQRLSSSTEYLVSLNQEELIDPEKILYKTHYTHPVYNAASVATQPLLQEMRGEERTYFCGSYHRYGFHEDAVRSGVDVARKLGVSW